MQVTDKDFLLVDLTTGTVLDSNVVAVAKDQFSEEDWNKIVLSDDAAFKAGKKHGQILYTEQVINSMPELFEAELDESQVRNSWDDASTQEAKEAALELADSLVNHAGFDADDSDQSGKPMHEDVMAALAFAALRIGLDDAQSMVL